MEKDFRDEMSQLKTLGLEKGLTPENYRKFLQTIGRMTIGNKISTENAILVYAQNPEAKVLMGYDQWQIYGRQVTSAASAIRIFSLKKQRNITIEQINNYAKKFFKGSKDDFLVYEIPDCDYKICVNKDFSYDVLLYGQVVHKNLNEQQMINQLNQIINALKSEYVAVPVHPESVTIEKNQLWVKPYMLNSHYVMNAYTSEECVLESDGKYKIKEKIERNKRGQIKTVPDKYYVNVHKNRHEAYKKNYPDMVQTIKDNDKAANLYQGLKETVQDIYKININENENQDYLEKINSLFKQWSGEMIYSKKYGKLEMQTLAAIIASYYELDTDFLDTDNVSAFADMDYREKLNKVKAICANVQKVISRLEANLNEKGLKLNLQTNDFSVMKKEQISEFIKAESKFILQELEKIEDNRKNFLIANNLSDNEKFKEIVEDQIYTLHKMKQDIDTLIVKVPGIKNIRDYNQQLSIKAEIEAAHQRYEKLNGVLEENMNRMNEYLVNRQEQKKGVVKESYLTNPLEVLRELQKSEGLFKGISDKELRMIASSGYIKKNYSKYIGQAPSLFEDLAIRHMENIRSIKEKNGCAIEIIVCDEWKDVFHAGEVVSPKYAEMMVSKYEKVIEQEKIRAKKESNVEIPCTECQLRIHAENGRGTPAIFSTTIKIGDGTQSSLAEHLKQVSKTTVEKNISTLFQESAQKGYKTVKVPANVEAVKKELFHRKEQKEKSYTPSMIEWNDLVETTAQEKVLEPADPEIEQKEITDDAR